jgi:hypothetical protein
MFFAPRLRSALRACLHSTLYAQLCYIFIYPRFAERPRVSRAGAESAGVADICD